MAWVQPVDAAVDCAYSKTTCFFEQLLPAVYGGSVLLKLLDDHKCWSWFALFFMEGRMMHPNSIWDACELII
jgi:hypothetical protein